MGKTKRSAIRAVLTTPMIRSQQVRHVNSCRFSVVANR